MNESVYKSLQSQSLKLNQLLHRSDNEVSSLIDEASLISLEHLITRDMPQRINTFLNSSEIKEYISTCIGKLDTLKSVSSFQKSIFNKMIYLSDNVEQVLMMKTIQDQTLKGKTADLARALQTFRHNELKKLAQHIEETEAFIQAVERENQ